MGPLTGSRRGSAMPGGPRGALHESSCLSTSARSCGGRSAKHWD